MPILPATPIATEKAGLVSKKERGQIVAGLQQIRDEIRAGKFEFKIELEDVRITGRGRSHVCKNVLQITLSNASTAILATSTFLRRWLRQMALAFPTTEMRASGNAFGKRNKPRP